MAKLEAENVPKLARELLRQRRLRSLTLKDVGRLVGKSPSTINRFEKSKGKFTPEGDTLGQIWDLVETWQEEERAHDQAGTLVRKRYTDAIIALTWDDPMAELEDPMEEGYFYLNEAIAENVRFLFESALSDEKTLLFSEGASPEDLAALKNSQSNVNSVLKDMKGHLAALKDGHVIQFPRRWTWIGARGYNLEVGVRQDIYGLPLELPLKDDHKREKMYEDIGKPVGDFLETVEQYYTMQLTERIAKELYGQAQARRRVGEGEVGILERNLECRACGLMTAGPVQPLSTDDSADSPIFCCYCGEALGRHCPKCGHLNEHPGAKFCNECAEPLNSGISDEVIDGEDAVEALTDGAEGRAKKKRAVKLTKAKASKKRGEPDMGTGLPG